MLNMNKLKNIFYQLFFFFFSPHPKIFRHINTYTFIEINTMDVNSYACLRIIIFSKNFQFSTCLLMLKDQKKIKTPHKGISSFNEYEIVMY